MHVAGGIITTLFVVCFAILSAASGLDHGHGGAYHVMLANSPCSIAVNMQESVTLACQPVVQLGDNNLPPETTSDSSPETPVCSVRTARWRRLESQSRQFVNVTSSSKFLKWSSEAVESVRTFEGLSQPSAASFLRIAALRDVDLSRYRCEFDCQMPNGHHVTHQYEAVVCQRHLGVPEYQLCPVEFVYHSGALQRCDISFGDGTCDRHCDLEQTLFDGFDCVDATSSSSSSSSSPPATSSGSQRSAHQSAAAVSSCGLNDGVSTSRVGGRTKPGTTGASMVEVKCRRAFADGVCDSECDNGPCAWDGGDCINKALRLTDDVLVLNWSLDLPHVVSGSSKMAATTGPVKQLIRSLSRLLRVVVRVINDDWPATSLDDVMITLTTPVPPSGDVESGARQARTSLMKIDNTNCLARCFTTARSAAMFISAALSKGWKLSEFKINSVAVLERIDLNHRCALNNSISTESGSSMSPSGASRKSTQYFEDMHASMPSVGTLFWVIIVAAVGGTIVVLLVAAVVMLVRQICRDRRPLSSRHRASAKRRKGQGQAGRHHGAKTQSSSMQLSACPSTEPETASSLYCWNDMEVPGGSGLGLLAPNSATMHAVETEAWPAPPPIGLPTQQRYGTDV